MYIDPAAGSMILQIVGAGIVSVLAFTKTVRQNISHGIRSIFGRRRAG